MTGGLHKMGVNGTRASLSSSLRPNEKWSDFISRTKQRDEPFHPSNLECNRSILSRSPTKGYLILNENEALCMLFKRIDCTMISMVGYTKICSPLDCVWMLALVCS